MLKGAPILPFSPFKLAHIAFNLKTLYLRGADTWKPFLCHADNPAVPVFPNLEKLNLYSERKAVDKVSFQRFPALRDLRLNFRFSWAGVWIGAIVRDCPGLRSLSYKVISTL